MNPIHELHELGQSIWLDFIRRDLLSNGQLAGLIEAGELRGMTSNPSIFEEAIARSDLYNDAIRPLAQAGWGPELIFESLAVDDVRAASDLFLALYEGSDGRDGFVSIEVNPLLADDTEGTLIEARRLWESVNRPNLMVKIPATEAGIPAIEQAIFEGINVNVTLVFSLDRYSQVMEAYLSGLERRMAAGLPIDRVASVASFFVSRVDTAVDGKLEAILRDEGAGAPKALALLGKAAIANAKLAYAQFEVAFADPRFGRLREVGGRTQRPLWASTSTKNPAYSDVLYVEELVGKGTVNTLPPTTLSLFRDHGRAELTLVTDLAVARAQLDTLAELGISMEAVTQELEADGVRKFAKSFESLLKVVAQRASRMQQELGPHAQAIADALNRLDRDRVAARFWRRDPNLWSASRRGADLAGRLNWLDLEFGELGDRFETLTAEARRKGVRKIGWIGPVGALGAIKAIVGSEPDLEIVPLESIDPEELRSFAEGTPIASTLFVLAGSEALERAGLELSWQRARAEVHDQAGERFIALAAAGSSLEAAARGRGFGQTVGLKSNAPLVPALLQAAQLGGSPSELLRGAAEMRGRSGAGGPAARNPGLLLGAFLGAVGASGVRRVGLVADPPLIPLADWLAAEMSARGVGSHLSILSAVPVEMALGDAAVIYLRTSGGLDEAVGKWQEKDAPVLVLQPGSGLAAVGAEAVRWEIGAAIAAHLLEIDPFPPGPSPSQPAKLVKTFQKKRKFDFRKPTWQWPELSIWSTASRLTLDPKAGVAAIAEAILGRLGPGQTLLLGLYFARGPSTDENLGRIAVVVGEGQSADFLSWHGRMPSQVRRPGASVALLLAVEPQTGSELPELRISAGELQLIQAMSDFGRLEASGDEAYLIRFKSVDSAAEFLRIMGVATDR